VEGEKRGRGRGGAFGEQSRAGGSILFQKSLICEEGEVGGQFGIVSGKREGGGKRGFEEHQVVGLSLPHRKGRLPSGKGENASSGSVREKGGFVGSTPYLAEGKTAFLLRGKEILF